MILYLDASALVKRYLQETASAEVEQLIQAAALTGTAMISRAEVSAALAKAVRLKWVAEAAARQGLAQFQSHWDSLLRLHIHAQTVAQADALAWQYGLRGYDAVHLACAQLWQQTINEPITVAAFDEQLWRAAQQAGLRVWPEALV